MQWACQTGVYAFARELTLGRFLLHGLNLIHWTGFDPILMEGLCFKYRKFMLSLADRVASYPNLNSVTYQHLEQRRL
jgi:hypothetical protein